MSQPCIVYVTCPPDAADSVAERVLELRLAACVNQLPAVRSLYRWEGGIQRDEECLLLIKTDDAHFEPLRRAVLDIHPYELPEIVAVQISDAHAPYLQWITDSLT